MRSPTDLETPELPRWRSMSHRGLLIGLVILSLLASLLPGNPARANEPSPLAVDRSPVVQAWLAGGSQVRTAAERALIGSDEDIQTFLDEGWEQAQRLDERDALVAVIAEAGPALRTAAQQALTAADDGNTDALSDFLRAGWQQPSNTDTRLRVNQLMATGGNEVKAAAQEALDSPDPFVWREFLESGWQSRWLIDQRIRVNQAMAAGGPQVKAAGQKALDAGTPEAFETFLSYGWSVAAAQDQETETLTSLQVQAQAQGDLAAQETQRAEEEAARAKEAAEAARRSAQEAAAATDAARQDTAEAAAQAKRAAVAAQKAATAAKVAVRAAASANRAARAAAAAAQRAASAAAQADRAATKAYNAAAQAATDESKADEARATAQKAREQAGLARELGTIADLAGKAIQAGSNAIDAVKAAVAQARLAAAANDEAVQYANAAGANASAAVAAAEQARADADRALRAANAAQKYLNVAAQAAFAARDAANRAAQHAEDAADAAIDAANHAGDAATAAQRASEAANSATIAAQAAVEIASQAIEVYDAAREADSERLAVFQDERVEAAHQAAAQYDEAQAAATWDALQAEQRDAETDQLIAEALNPATETAAAVTAARKVAMNLMHASGTWTRQAAQAALGGSDAQVMEFVRTGIAEAAGQDDRIVVGELAISENTSLRDAALAALEGSDAEVSQFLATQDYPGRYIQDRLKVNQIMAAAKDSGDTHLAQKAQEALSNGDGQVLRTFIASGQHTAAAISQRIQVNQILASAESGPEVKAAAQIALTGPPPGLHKFLTEGRYAAAERDQSAAAHLAVVASLVERINEVAQTATQDAMNAQAVAAEARDDAASAADYANQAAQSAQAAATYAAQAVQYANQASKSVAEAEAAVQTAKTAATQAVDSARSAIRSASWAILSHERAVQAARKAQAFAQAAYDSAIAAGKSAEEAAKAAEDARREYKLAEGREVAICTFKYNDAGDDWDKFLTDESNDAAENCVRNVIVNPSELTSRAYINAGYCDVYTSGSQYYKNCIASVLSPTFLRDQTLTILTAIIEDITALLIPVAGALAIGCLLTVVCGTVAATLLTIGEVGFNFEQYISGDQDLADTLLDLGALALEALAFAGAAKLVGTGFQAAKQLYTISRAAKQAEANLAVANSARRELRLRSCLTGSSFPVNAPAPAVGSGSKPIAHIREGDRIPATSLTAGATVAESTTNVIRNTDVTVALTTGSTALRTAPKHPFWTSGTGHRIDTADLSARNALHTAYTARGTNTRTYPGQQVAHNLTVGKTHTYHVPGGTVALLVQNGTGCLDGEVEYDIFDPTTGNKITDIDIIENGELWELKGGQPWWENEEWMAKHIDLKFANYLKSRPLLPTEYHNAVIGFRFTNNMIDTKTREVITERLRRLAEDAGGVPWKVEFAS
ncbi:polymorphic toxin-type HINT domain-containing protein [Salinispora arenicola]|uniref:polymorphic toxin-type HINT domain-containing protein n=1 Tax=Salinispora arenicola TaxID=168697 RepID=UPI001E46EFAF|nr:polymorphic toxin-type HINT domain-containing protein [Salinispora arenicola]